MAIKEMVACDVCNRIYGEAPGGDIAQDWIADQVDEWAWEHLGNNIPDGSFDVCSLKCYCVAAALDEKFILFATGYLEGGEYAWGEVSLEGCCREDEEILTDLWLDNIN